MMRNLKVLGVAMVAALAFSAVAVSAASATGPKFTAAKYPATVHGSTAGDVFSATGISVECTTSTFSGSLAASSETLTINPVYTGCKGFFGVAATVKGFGHLAEEAGKPKCDYLFHTNTNSNPATARVDIVCGAGASITIESSPCTVHIGPQTGLQVVNLTNDVPSAGKVTADSNITGIHGTVTRNNFLCPTHEGTFTNGTYKGSVPLSGTSGGVATAIDVK